MPNLRYPSTQTWTDLEASSVTTLGKPTRAAVDGIGAASGRTIPALSKRHQVAVRFGLGHMGSHVIPMAPSMWVTCSSRSDILMAVHAILLAEIRLDAVTLYWGRVVPDHSCTSIA